jgi:hypothetical protein
MARTPRYATFVSRSDTPIVFVTGMPTKPSPWLHAVIEFATAIRRRLAEKRGRFKRQKRGQGNAIM